MLRNSLSSHKISTTQLPHYFGKQVVEGSTLKQLADAYKAKFVLRAEKVVLLHLKIMIISWFAYLGRYGANIKVRGKSVPRQCCLST